MSEFLRFERFTGWHMFTLLVLFFGVIVSVNLTLAWYANSTWTGLVVKNSYVASQQFNERTAERERQAAMGWQSQLTYGDGQVTLQLLQADTAPIEAMAIVARLGRPAFEADDHVVTFTAAGNGNYVAETTLGPGIWQADLTASDAQGVKWEHSIRFTVARAE